ncbi:MAG: hypothetical protein JXE06_07855 [Coriobacteriia bacterium]|nr:hypothetical protein [Coriobacteriia bacterium]MBN2822543.1 hypothetical protein [Coriobacteriia bacterium]
MPDLPANEEAYPMSAACEFAPGCAVFNAALEGMPHTALRYRQRYCYSAIQECARYRLARALGRQSVPPTLLPNQDSEAQEILAAKR